MKRKPKAKPNSRSLLIFSVFTVSPFGVKAPPVLLQHLLLLVISSASDLFMVLSISVSKPNLVNPSAKIHAELRRG
ncbi:hypothetical protein L3X38_008816 [Prunus dulcis]|uniref:Uncharacterized protein n=1 Tax=Prunus dulcis TaxID=3755 RepID=A0AAD5F774_PRUDU|nr:hypothetical protein L3X38_008816 [Prunus dulcis]